MPDVSEIIRAAAARYGLPPDLMLRIAKTESNLDPNSAHPKSSARGLYQFMTAPGGSWGEYGRGGNALDPVANADAGMRYTLDNQKHLRTVLGRDPTPGETYLAHQQGRAGAAELLRDPNRPAVDAVAKFYKNPQTASDAITLNGGTPGMTAGQFAQKWTSRFDGGAAPAVNGTAPTVGATPAAPMPAQNPQQQRAEVANPMSDMLATLAQTMMAAPQQPLAAKKQKKPLPEEQPVPATTEIASPLTFA